MTLDEIAIANGTDKATVFTRTYAKPKGYTVHMERFFEPFRDHPIKFLEIGIGGGESARTWLQYFAKALVYGVDKVEKTNDWNTPGAQTHPRYKFLQGDQTDPVMWQCWLADCGPTVDIVLDDCSHKIDGITQSFRSLWPAVASGGLYLIEDLACAYGVGSVFLVPGLPTHMEWLKAMIDEMHQGRGDIDFVYFAQELAIIHKRCQPNTTPKHG